jgi:hypothetical protein
MPGYLQRLASAGARIVPSRGSIAARRAMAPPIFPKEPTRAEAAMPSPPVATPPISAGSDEGPRSAPLVETLETLHAPEAVRPTRLRLEPMAPGPAAPVAQPESREPQIAQAVTGIDPPTEEQPRESTVEPGAAPLPFAAAHEPATYEPPSYEKTRAHEAHREPLRAPPQMTVLNPSEPSPFKETRTPEKHLPRLPRIEVTPQTSAKALPAMSWSPPPPSVERIAPRRPDARIELSPPRPGPGSITPKKPEARADLAPPHPSAGFSERNIPEDPVDLSSPRPNADFIVPKLSETPPAAPVVPTAPLSQRATPDTRRRFFAPVPAGTSGGGLTIQRLEVQIVERPRNEINEPPPAPVAPAGSAWDWPDRRHQGRVW